MIGDERGEALEPGARARDVTALPPEDVPRLGDEEGRRAVVAARLLGERHDALPVALLGAPQIAQEHEGRFEAGIVLERLLEQLAAELGVLVARGPAHAVAEGRVRARRALERVEDPPLRLDDGLRAILLEQQLLEAGGDLLIARIALVGAGEQPLDVTRREALGHARRAQVQAPARLVIGGRVRGVEQRRHVIVPGVRVDLHVGEAGPRLLAGADRSAERARIDRRGLLVVPRVREHVAELEQQRGGEGIVLDHLELELEELLDHVHLPQAPVDAPRVPQRREQLGAELEGVLEVLERLDGEEELVLQDLPQLEVIARLDGGVPLGGDALLELLDEPLPVTNRLQMIQTLRKIHNVSALGPVLRRRQKTFPR